MGMFTKIPQNTFESLQLETGVLLKTFDPAKAEAPKDEDIICATTGGITISCVPAYSDMGADVDNCPANTKELMHLDSWACSMAFNCLSTGVECIKLALGAADVSGNSVVPRRDLQQEDFKDIWWAGDRADGGWAAVRLINALSTSGLSLKTSKNGKGQMAVTLTGHSSMNNQDVVPMEFFTSGAVEAAAVQEGDA